MPRTQDFLDEPTMSDTTILVTVEDLINRAMGPTDANIVNFKLIQTILHILARQQRMLQQRVEIRIIEIRKEERSRRKKHGDESTEEKSSIENPSPGIVKSHKSPQRGDKKDKPPTLDIKDKVQQKDRSDRKEHKRDEKIKSKEKGEITSYETKQMQMMVNKIEEEEEEVIIKETKGQGKFKKLPQKETEEKGQQESNKISQKEKGKWETEKKMDQKEPDKRSQKERDKEKKAGQRESNTYTESESEGQQPEIALIKMDIEEKLGNREPEKEREIWGNEGQQREKEKNRLADPNVVAQKEPEQMMQKEMERWEKQKKIEQKEPQKMTQAERDIWKKMGPEKTGKIAQKEKERLEREDIKEERSRLYEQKTEKERSAREPDLDRKKTAQRSNIEITEKIIDNENILVVGKRPPTRQDAPSSGSIAVVSRAQFELLEDAVAQLRRLISPQPLQLPDNKQLMSDVIKGTATLPDAMHTLQIDAKLRAAEDAVVRMAGLLTQLAAAGELPEELLEQLEALEPAYAGLQAQADRSRPLVAKKSVAIDPRAARSKASRVMEMEHHGEQGTPDMSLASRPSAMSRASRTSTISATERVPCVTHEDLKVALKDLRDDILKAINNMTARASTSAENALHFAKGVADKLGVALQLDERISTLFSVLGDYAEQLNGFDSGLTTQMQGFQDQMAHMRADLRGGLVQLENVNNNAETAAVLELTERCDELAAELDSTLTAHKALAALQAQLGCDMRNLVECMEMLREQKADRDEVLDGLRDKADTSRLAGLLSELDFAEARTDFERRIDLCHEKFDRQDEVWQTAIRELKAATDKKAELVELLSARDEAQRRLQELNDKIRLLAAALGEPKTALLTRKLADGATCGSCHVRALMEPYEAAHGAPRALPALRPPPVGASQEPCIADLVAGEPSEDRHICHRWCGGSHTLVTEFTRRAQAPAGQLAGLARKFQGYGADGRLYMMEEECQPCVECNLLSEEETLQVLPAPPGHGGARDMSPGREPPLECTCPLTD